ncbi:MAG: TlpA disulfide reductase family protein [Chitinophagaceae bacterium]
MKILSLALFFSASSFVSIAQQSLPQAALVYSVTDTRIVNGGAPRYTTSPYIFAYAPGEYHAQTVQRNINMLTVTKCDGSAPLAFMSKDSTGYVFDEPVKSPFLDMGKIKLQPSAITYTEESATIRGFECKKAIMKLQVDGQPEEVQVWYAPAYRMDGCFDNFFRELKGLPVSVHFNFISNVKFSGVDVETTREYLLDSLYTNIGLARIPLPAEGSYTKVSEEGRMKAIGEIMSDSRRAAPRGTATTTTTMSGNNFVVTRTVFNPFTIGDTLVAFSGTGRDGVQKSSTSDYSNKAMVINFWFTQCGPCIKEMPILNNAVTRYKGKNVSFVSITYSNAKELEPFFKQNQFAFEHIIDASHLIKQYGVSSYPATVITDKNHIIRFVKVGSFADETELNKEIEKVL